MPIHPVEKRLRFASGRVLLPVGNRSHARSCFKCGLRNPRRRRPTRTSRPTGRPADAVDPCTSKYLDLSVEPLFPFGHGISFSRVELKNLRLNRTEFHAQDWIKVEVDAINTGRLATEETIFLFVHDLVSTVARPLLELKAWAKVALDPNQSKVVAFTLPAESFRVLDENFESVLEPGDFYIHVGLNRSQRRSKIPA